MKPIGTKEGAAQAPVTPGVARGTRVVRIALCTMVVLGIEWRMADPLVVASDPNLWVLPWSMLFLMAPVGLGVWAYSVTTPGTPGLKVDGLWGVLIGTLTYCLISQIV